VRFVDREEGELCVGGAEPSREGGESLRRAIQQRQLAVYARVQHHAALLRVELAVHVRRRDSSSPERANLILHQRDERRDHQRQPVTEQRGHLIAKRLPRPGREDGEHVSARQQWAEDFELVNAEARMTEVLLEDEPGRVESTAKENHPPHMH